MTIEEAIKYWEQAFDKSCRNNLFQNAEKIDYEDAIWAALAALRAQQETEKNEPCDFCEKFDFGNVKAKIDKYEAYLSFSGGTRHFPLEEQFNFCPVCGRSLKQSVSKEARNV